MKTSFKSGTYFVGDPCYAVPDELWDEYCDKIIDDGGAFDLDGITVWCAGTAYGDGVYRGSDGYRYSVDAGLIGITPVSIAKRSNQELKRLGRIVTFDKEFTVEQKDGTFYIGSIEILTGDE